jgi:hypothetical protein
MQLAKPMLMLKVNRYSVATLRRYALTPLHLHKLKRHPARLLCGSAN